jgi:hypothetical protein
MMRDWYGVTGKAGIERRKGSLYQSRLISHVLSVTHFQSRFINLLRRCHECGQPLGKKDVFCPRCGAKQPRDPKRRWTGFPGLKVKIRK